ncbi:CDP-diacylglycerol---serine O-phosphatidyltransferase [Loktanella atrilutea]|uniref:CDP-diacylglycerol--serine O-phosphatidyltransferase n=1 Tax=Loktanella atrilutea TaxID=366533 RepID=A0A1M4UGG8_LOKAT|nr:CDP-diacylglycerol--serine O-phosphatidyltransferase [Loktanella atrilutea]SHE55851.1 CDP-diacylglycerol---serine O-phosphatidyltransferase [Loktanella atrilutea]
MARRDVPLLQLLPNALTITAIGAGLSAIRAAVEHDFKTAVLLILFAALLDGIDGRVARLLGSYSKVGAELDSLADFVNFGVAAPLMLYFWALQDYRKIGWIAVLVFAICCVLRLARFNVDAKEAPSGTKADHFVGVPSPAGAMLVLLPMFTSFAFADAALLPDPLLCLYMAGIGLLMISGLRTSSFKSVRIARGNVRYALLGVVVLIAALLAYPWITLVALCLAYIVGVVWGALRPSH